MNSLHCPDCSVEVPSTAQTCPECHFPIAKLMGLSSAILTKDVAMVAGFIQLGADVNTPDKNGRTPLMIASTIGSVEIVQMLMAAGADPLYKNEAGETALSIARSREVEKILRRALVVSKFISNRKQAPQPKPVVSEPAKETAPAAVEQKIDFDATQPIPSAEWNLQEIALSEPAPKETPVEEKPKPEKNLEDELLESPVLFEPFLSVEFQEPEEIKTTHPQIAEAPEEEVANTINEEPSDTINNDEIIEETAYVSPLMMREPVEIIDVVATDLQEVESAEETSVEQPVLEDQNSVDPFMKLITDPHAFNEMSLWENRRDDYFPVRPKEEVSPELEPTVEPVNEFLDTPNLHQPFLSFQLSEPVPEPQMLEESEVEEVSTSTVDAEIIEETAFISPLIIQEPIEIRQDRSELVAANETIDQVEEPVEDQPIETYLEPEDPFLKFISGQQSFTNRVEDFSPVPSSTPEPVELHLSETQQIEPPEREISDVPANPQLNTEFQVEQPPSLSFNTAQQLQSKFEQREEWIELDQPTEPVLWQQEEYVSDIEVREKEPIALPPFENTETPIPLNCLECGQIIGPHDIKCTRCNTTIVRRYCSGCSQLIPDHSIFCPYCKTYIRDHFHFSRKDPEKYIMGLTIGLCVLILLMFLTWPDRNAKLAGKSASRGPIPIQKAPKAETPKSADIVFIPPETEPEPKPVITEKTPERNIAPVKKVAAVKKPIKTKPAAAIVKSEMPKTVTVKSERPKTVTAKSWSTPPDSHDIQKGQALSDKGVSLIRQGRPGEAIPVLEQSLRSFPKGAKHGEYASALFNLGIAWRMAGRPDIAIPILQKSIKINGQRDEVERELQTARQQARDAGFGSFQ